jgi:hypothetical protein
MVALIKLVIFVRALKGWASHEYANSVRQNFQVMP